MLAGADRPTVDDITEEDATVADFAGVGGFEDYIDCRLYEYVATNDCESHTLDYVGVVGNATVDALLT